MPITAAEIAAPLVDVAIVVPWARRQVVMDQRIFDRGDQVALPPERADSRSFAGSGGEHQKERKCAGRPIRDLG